ncbi:response regulator [Thiohalospira sp.]|uniref:response regulator n=1 Tax=Thiohalospira sp. TaxID=3080549 RepID=UPI00397FC654
MATDPPYAGLRVLVIDDSQTIRKSAETILGRAGCEVTTAADGFEALARVVEDRPDVVFVDIMMPRLDGYQTTALIKGSEGFRNIPVVLLTSKDGLFDRARGRVVGADHYLTKPFASDEILGVLEEIAPRPA